MCAFKHVFIARGTTQLFNYLSRTQLNSHAYTQNGVCFQDRKSSIINSTGSCDISIDKNCMTLTIYLNLKSKVDNNLHKSYTLFFLSFRGRIDSEFGQKAH